MVGVREWMEQVTQERIEQLEGYIAYRREEVSIHEGRIKILEAELARLRAEHQGWRKTRRWAGLASDGREMVKYERADRKPQHVPADLVAHIEAEATKTMREQYPFTAHAYEQWDVLNDRIATLEKQLEEAAVLLGTAIDRHDEPRWYDRRDELLLAIRDSAGEGNK